MRQSIQFIYLRMSSRQCRDNRIPHAKLNKTQACVHTIVNGKIHHATTISLISVWNVSCGADDRPRCAAAAGCQQILFVNESSSWFDRWACWRRLRVGLRRGEDQSGGGGQALIFKETSLWGKIGRSFDCQPGWRLRTTAGRDFLTSLWAFALKQPFKRNTSRNSIW